MPSTQGRIYLGSILVASPGETWDYTQPYPPDAGTDAVWTIPGTLQQTFTTSGTYTPAVGVSTVHVVVVGGGSNAPYSDGSTGGAGGGGGTVRVYRNVPVSGDVTVTIGGADTGSSFGALTAPSRTETDSLGRIPKSATCNGDGIGYGGLGVYDPAASAAGRDGVSVNGTYYGGGGGGGQRNGSGSGERASGGAGGGGAGGNYNTAASNGGSTGGGGGGHGTPSPGSGGLGGSGRVMIWSEDV